MKESKQMGAFPGPDASSTTVHRSLAQPAPAVVVQDLVRVFDKKVAVNHLNLRVERGEFFGFLGPNGAGKSTTIKMMVGLLRPTAGSVWVGGVDVWKNPLQARAL